MTEAEEVSGYDTACYDSARPWAAVLRGAAA